MQPLPRGSARSRAKPYDGVTIQFAKAPFGTDEKDVIAKLLEAVREDKTGAKVVHTVVPWNVEGATYATNYAGPNPFDVSYQTSTDLTGLGTKGVLEVAEHEAVARTARTTRRRRRSSSRTRSRRAPTRGSSTACRASSAARSSTTTRTCSGRPASPTSRGPSPSSTAAALKVQKLGSGDWGHNVSLSNKDFTWYFLYHGLHNRGVDIISKDQSKVTFNVPQAACGAAVLRRHGHQVQGAAAGRPVRPRGRRVAVQGRAGSASCTTSRCGLRSSASEKLPFKWDFINPVGRRRQADDLLDDRPLGHGRRRARTRTPPGSS